MEYMTKETFQRLYHADKGHLQPPDILFLNVTSDCSFSCKFCGKKIIAPSSNANYEAYRFIVFQLLGVPEIHEKYIHALFNKGKDKVYSLLLKEGGEKYNKKINRIQELIDNSKPLDINVYSNKIRSYIGKKGNNNELFRRFVAYIGFLINDMICRDFKTNMSLKEYLRILHEAKDFGVKHIYLSGSTGEPLIEKDKTMAIMKEIKELGFEGLITTNGFYVDENFVDFSVEIGWDDILVSLDGAMEETHDYLRGVPGAYKGVINTIKRFRDAKEKYKSALPKLTFNFVINKLNFREIPDVIELAKRYKVNSVSITPMTLHLNLYREELVLNKKQEQEFWDITEKLRDQLESEDAIKTNIPDIVYNMESLHVNSLIIDSTALREIERDIKFLNESAYIPTLNISLENAYCYMPWNFIMVETNGAIRICCLPYIPLINENIRTKSLKNIWHGKRYQMLRYRMLTDDAPIECKYNCQPNYRIHQEMLRSEYKRLKNIYENTIELPEKMRTWLNKLESYIEKIVGKQGPELLNKILLVLGFRYKDIEYF